MNSLPSGRMEKVEFSPGVSRCNWFKARFISLLSSSFRGSAMKTMPIIILLFLPMFLPGQTNASAPPSSVQKHSPRKASLYSAILPGLGQAYNKKYWKIPIIYGGFGALFYLTRENTLEYRKFLEAYRYVVNNETYPIENSYVDRYNEQQLLSGKNLYQRNVEVGYIIAGALYILNIIDASVDAHFFYYDISEDLSMKLEPAMINNPMVAKPFTGLSLTLRF